MPCQDKIRQLHTYYTQLLSNCQYSIYEYDKISQKKGKIYGLQNGIKERT